MCNRIFNDMSMSCQCHFQCHELQGIESSRNLSAHNVTNFYKRGLWFAADGEDCEENINLIKDRTKFVVTVPSEAGSAKR